jgi:uncharacterized membrane protein YeiH
VTTEPALLVCLDLGGTFTYAVNGGLTAVRAARLDIVGVVTVAMVSGLGGGIIRDILLGALPPATFSDGRYLAVAAAGGLAAFALGSQLAGLATLITVLDAAGLGLFAVTGASKALGLGLGAAPAVILGAITGVGVGALRDVLLGQIPSVLRRGLYAIPALSAAMITVTAVRAGIYGLPAALGAVLACFLIRVLGVRYDPNALRAPQPPQHTRRSRRTKSEIPVAVSKAARITSKAARRVRSTILSTSGCPAHRRHGLQPREQDKQRHGPTGTAGAQNPISPSRRHQGEKETMNITDTLAGRDLEALRAAIAGQVFVPGQAGYDQARQAWNLAVDTRPAVVVAAESAADVAQAVRYARAHRMRIAPQGSGHGAPAPGAADRRGGGCGGGHHRAQRAGVAAGPAQRGPHSRAGPGRRADHRHVLRGLRLHPGRRHLAADRPARGHRPGRRLPGVEGRRAANPPGPAARLMRAGGAKRDQPRCAHR